MVSDSTVKMEYWNLTSKSRGQRSISLGTQHRVFSSGVRKHDESKGREIKGGQEEGAVEDIKKDDPVEVKPKDEEKVEENKEGGGASSSTETRVPAKSTDSGPPSGEEKSSDSLKRKRDHTEQETEQEDSKSSTDGEPNGSD